MYAPSGFVRRSTPLGQEPSFRNSREVLSAPGSAYGRGDNSPTHSGYFAASQQRSQSPGVYGQQEFGGRPTTGFTSVSGSYPVGTLPPDNVIIGDIQSSESPTLQWMEMFSACSTDHVLRCFRSLGRCQSVDFDQEGSPSRVGEHVRSSAR